MGDNSVTPQTSTLPTSSISSLLPAFPLVFSEFPVVSRSFSWDLGVSRGISDWSRSSVSLHATDLTVYANVVIAFSPSARVNCLVFYTSIFFYFPSSENTNNSVENCGKCSYMKCAGHPTFAFYPCCFIIIIVIIVIIAVVLLFSL